MEILKKDLAKLDDSHCISWTYSHLEGKEYFGNCFDAIVSYNIKENWVIIQLLRYNHTSKAKDDYLDLEKVWFIKNIDIDELKYNFFLYCDIEKKLYDNLYEDLKKESFTFCDFSESSDNLKKEIEKINSDDEKEYFS